MRLIDQKGRKHNFELTAGKRFFSNKGHLDHDEMIGRDEGFTVTSSAGGQYLVFRPLLSEFVVSMPRGAAVVYPEGRGPDRRARRHLPRCPRRRGRRRLGRPDLLAAARGRAVGQGDVLRAARGVRRGRQAQRRPVLQRARRLLAPRLGPAAWATSSWSCPQLEGQVDRIILDMLDPWNCIDIVAEKLVPGGIVCAYIATTTQLSRVVETLRAHGGFTEPHPWESLVRDWHVEGLAVRPDHKMIGHTAFLVTARRMAPGEKAAAQDPPPGAGCLRPRLHRPPTGRPAADAESAPTSSVRVSDRGRRLVARLGRDSSSASPRIFVRRSRPSQERGSSTSAPRRCPAWQPSRSWTSTSSSTGGRRAGGGRGAGHDRLRPSR